MHVQLNLQILSLIPNALSWTSVELKLILKNSKILIPIALQVQCQVKMLAFKVNAINAYMLQISLFNKICNNIHNQAYQKNNE